jgi:signal transduction histidine kinase
VATSYTSARGGTRSSGRQAAIEKNVRRLVARELHDRVAQTLTGMLVDVENFKSQQVSWEDVIQQLDLIQTSTRLVLNNLRQLLHDLRGEELVGDTLVDALSALVTRFEQKTSIATELEVRPGWPDSLTSPASLNLYRIVEEALANVRMHSGARTVRVVLQKYSQDEVALVVEDDGRGLDTDPSRLVGLGMVGMRERALFLGGQLRIESEAGTGTRLQVVFPKSQLVRTAEHLAPSAEFSLAGRLSA